MAVNTLNMLFSVQKQISDMEGALKALKETEKELTEKVLSSGSMENRYYRVISKVRAGDRVVQVHLIRESYPDIYQKTVIESIKITDLKKYLGDEIISQVSIKKPDSIRYIVEKKEVSSVVVA